jgi:hypothetical protein
MKIFKDIIASDSPASTIKTPVIIGFLTYPYIPEVTSFFVGLQGANVPLPIRMTVDIAIIRIYKPMQMKTSPEKKTGKFLTDRSRSMIKGIIISTVTGNRNERICFIKFFMI